MKVLLTKDVPHLGQKGDIVDVSDGYGRNFLIAKSMGKIADACVKNEHKQKDEAEKFHNAEILKEAQEVAKKLNGFILDTNLQFGVNGKAFGSITSKEISEMLAQKGFVIDKKKLVVDIIKNAGKFEVVAKLHPKVTAKFFVSVSAE